MINTFYLPYNPQILLNEKGMASTVWSFQKKRLVFLKDQGCLKKNYYKLEIQKRWAQEES